MKCEKILIKNSKVMDVMAACCVECDVMNVPS